MKKIKPSKLLDANTAVESYLDHLLQEATEPVAEPNVKFVANNENHNIHVLETPLTALKQLTKDDVVITAEVSVNDNETELEKTSIKLQKKKAQERTLKEELNFPVQCLMFKVKGHLLSIPLIRMGSVVPFGNRLTQLPYSPNYFKGLLKHRDSNVRVADTAALLMGIVQGKDNDDFNPSHLLVFKDNDWAISCDELLDVVTLNEDDIKWHTGEKDRLSLGTIKKTLALVLNPEAIRKKLIKTDDIERMTD